MYPVDTAKVTVRIEDIKDEDKWVEIPNDRRFYALYQIGLDCREIIPIKVELANKHKAWLTKRRSDWREALQIGDIIDVKDTQNKWYESVVRYVYPPTSNKYGKCVIHYIGWREKYDEELNINDRRLAKRNTYTSGPHPV